MGILDVMENASRYQIAGTTGAIGASAATKIIFYAQNLSTTKVALIERIRIDGHYATTAYAVGAVLYELHIARGFTAENGTPHGTALTITGNNQRLKTGESSTALAVVRITDTTAAGITAPTWTLDSNPVGQLVSHSSAGTGAATPIIGNQYLPNDGTLFAADLAAGEWPIVLGLNEGIGIRVTVPATGVGIHGVTMKWAETDRVNL